MKARKERAKARLETGEAAPTKKTIESMRKLFDKIPSYQIKVGCVFSMVIVSILSHAEFGRTDHREDAAHFRKSYSKNSIRENLFRVRFS